jgi:branched-chain amino acid transport system ATP-binding protein
VLLEVSRLSKRFGGLAALSHVDLAVAEGAVHGIIGPNGSGKSTLFNLVTGIYRADPGSHVWFQGEQITHQEPHQIARRGIGRTFQLLRMFAEMSVIENVLVGRHSHVAYGIGAALFGTGRVRMAERQLREEMLDLLAFIGLADYAEMPAGELSIGQRRLLALGRAMAMKPTLLLLDEPAAGLSPINVDRLLDTMLSLKARYGLTIILVEHVMKLVMTCCDTVTVLDHGEKIAEGSPSAIRDDRRVIEAYLGKEMGDAEVRAFLRSASPAASPLT